MMMIATAALFAVSCEDSTDDGGTTTYELSGDKYMGEMTILGTVQESIVFYAEEVDGVMNIMMPEVSFMTGLMPSLDMALIDIASIGSDSFYSATSQMVGIYDRLPLINDVIQSISNVSVVVGDNMISVSFICSISTTAMGDMDVPVAFVGYKDGYSPDPEFSMDNAEGFYITTSSGEVLLSTASLTYYEGNNALVIDGFSYSAYLSTTTLPIIGVSDSESFGVRTLTADDLVVSYLFMTMDATGTVNDLVCEIIDSKAQMSFTIAASMGGSGTPTDYPCTFNGDITINSGSYSAE